MSWTAQRPVAIGLALSFVAVLALLALVVFDRRRRAIGDAALAASPIATPAPRLAPVGATWKRSAAVATVVSTVGASALFIGWTWAPIAAAALVPAVVLRRSRVAGWIGVTIILGAGAVVTEVVRSERPYPNAGWPIRFEWLHGWTLLGVVLITCATLFADDARSDTSVRE